jgi:hypothetical protein
MSHSSFLPSWLTLRFTSYKIIYPFPRFLYCTTKSAKYTKASAEGGKSAFIPGIEAGTPGGYNAGIIDRETVVGC